MISGLGGNGQAPSGGKGIDVVETWHDMVISSIELGQQIENHCRTTGERFDRLLVIARGGLFTGNILARVLGFEAPEVYNMSIKTYREKERTGEVDLGQAPTPQEVDGHHWLSTDEVFDTGETAKFVDGYLWQNGAANVRTAANNYKPAKAAAGSGFKPDFYVRSNEPVWVHFPWEGLEKIGEGSVVRDISSTGQKLPLIQFEKPVIDS